MADGTRVSGSRPTSYLVRRLAVGLAMVGVLACSILGSGILTVQEAAPRAGVPITPTWWATSDAAETPLPWPSRTPTATRVPIEPAVPTGDTPRPDTDPRETTTPPPHATVATLPPLEPSPTATYWICGPPSNWRLYWVRADETLNLLAWRHSTTEAAIKQANCMQTNTVFAGQRLYLPPLQPPPTPVPPQCTEQPLPGWARYVVRPGDSLSGLAQRHGTTVRQIKMVNCLSSDLLIVGQPIWLPYLAPTATPTWTWAPTSTKTPTPALTATATQTVTATATVGAPTPTITWTVTPSMTVTATSTPTGTPAATQTPTAMWTPTTTGTPTATGTPTLVTSATPSPTATQGAETPSPTATQGAATSTPAATATVASTPTETATPLETATLTPTATEAPAATSTLPATATSTLTPMPAPTTTPTPIPTDTVAPTPTPAAANLL